MVALRGRRPELLAGTLAALSLVLLGLPAPVSDTISDRLNHVLLWPVARVRGGIGSLVGVREENAALRAEVQRARLELERTEAIRAENRELARLLRFAGPQPVQLVPARVVDRDFVPLATTFLVDAGRDDGIEEDLPVVTADGLVGKIVSAGARTSRVMLYAHPDFSASALLVGGDHLEYGVVRPGPEGDLRLFLPLRSHSEPGDAIVTSGYGGTFPRGIPLGHVVRATETDRLGLQKVDRVEPVVNLGGVTTVYVLQRAVSPGESAGEVVRLFWPGYAYPPMTGETFGRVSADSAAAVGDSAAAAGAAPGAAPGRP